MILFLSLVSLALFFNLERVVSNEDSHRWFRKVSSNPKLAPQNVTVELYKTYAVVSSEALVASSGASLTRMKNFMFFDSLIESKRVNKQDDLFNSGKYIKGSLSFVVGYQTPYSQYLDENPFAITKFYPKNEEDGFEFAVVLQNIQYHRNNKRDSDNDGVDGGDDDGGDGIPLNRGHFLPLIAVRANAPEDSHVHLTRIHDPHYKMNITFASSGTTVRSEEAYITPQAIYIWVTHYDQNFTMDVPLPQSVSLRTLLCSKGYLKIANDPPPHRDPFVGFHCTQISTTHGDKENEALNYSKQKKKWRFHGYLVWSPWLRIRSQGSKIPLDKPRLSKLTDHEEKLVKKWKLLHGKSSCSAMELQAYLPQSLTGKSGVTMVYGLGLGLGATPPLVENWIASLIQVIATLIGFAITGMVVYLYGKEYWKKRRRKGGTTPSPVRIEAKQQVDRVIKDAIHSMPHLRPSASKPTPETPLLP